MDERIKIEQNLLKYLEWYNDIDTESGYSISITPIREYLDTVFRAGWKSIERFIAEMVDYGIPYKNQVEIIIEFAKHTELVD